MKVRYCLSFQCPTFLHITGGVWVVFIRHCLRVSGWCLEFIWELRRSEDVSIPNPLAKANNRYCPNKYPIMHIKRLCVGWVSRWCLRVSGWCLDCVWGCLGRHQYQTSWEIDILSYDTQILPFLPVPSIAYKCLLCWGVWECLDGVWGCLGMY